MLRTNLVVGAMLLGLAGCSSQVTVDEAALEDEVKRQLTETVGQAPDDIDCPGDLAGEVDQEIRCTLTAGEDEVGVTVTVTGVEGDQVDFDIEVDEEMAN